MATLNFNVAEVEPSTGFEPIPAGKYLAVISEEEMKPTRNNNGQYLQLIIEIIEGDYQGRKFWARFNIDNPSQQAVNIARQELRAVCCAVNIAILHDSSELLNIPFVLKVGLKKNKETDEMENVIKGYEAKANYAPASAPVAPAPQTAKAPWAK